jgi:hypothetical protein
MSLKKIYELSKESDAMPLVFEILDYCQSNIATNLSVELMAETNNFRLGRRYILPDQYCNNIFFILLKYNGDLDTGHRAPVQGHRAPQDINQPNSAQQ